MTHHDTGHAPVDAEAVATVVGLMRDMPICLLTTVGTDGSSRPYVRRTNTGAVFDFGIGYVVGGVIRGLLVAGRVPAQPADDRPGGRGHR